MLKKTAILFIAIFALNFSFADECYSFVLTQDIKSTESGIRTSASQLILQKVHGYGYITAPIVGYSVFIPDSLNGSDLKDFIETSVLDYYKSRPEKLNGFDRKNLELGKYKDLINDKIRFTMKLIPNEYYESFIEHDPNTPEFNLAFEGKSTLPGFVVGEQLGSRYYDWSEDLISTIWNDLPCNLDDGEALWFHMISDYINNYLE